MQLFDDLPAPPPPTHHCPPSAPRCWALGTWQWTPRADSLAGTRGRNHGRTFTENQASHHSRPLARSLSRSLIGQQTSSGLPPHNPPPHATPALREGERHSTRARLEGAWTGAAGKDTDVLVTTRTPTAAHSWQHREELH